ncbi:hypothetical protein Tco_1189590 [Tanacetum coccineum]
MALIPIVENQTETSASQYERIGLETYLSVSEEEKKLIDAEEEAVHIILTGIDNDIYSTVDACPNAKEKWKAIERLMQGISKECQSTSLVAATQQRPVYYPQAKPNNLTPLSSTRLHASTQIKVKEITKAHSPASKSKHKVFSDEEETQRDKDI